MIPAKDGKKPTFLGDGADTAHQIRQKMLEVLVSKEEFDFLDTTGQEIVNMLRKEFSIFDINHPETDRPLLSSNEKLIFYSFTSSKINRTLSFIMNVLGIDHQLDKDILFEIEHSQSGFVSTMKNINWEAMNLDKVMTDMAEDIPKMLDFSKWGIYLPVHYQAELLKSRYFDFEECRDYLQRFRCIEN